MRIYVKNLELSQAMEEIRLSKGVTQAALAESLGTTQGAVNNILRGKFKGLPKRVLELCELLKIDSQKYVITQTYKIPVSLRVRLNRVCSSKPHRIQTLDRLLALLEDF